MKCEPEVEFVPLRLRPPAREASPDLGLACLNYTEKEETDEEDLDKFGGFLRDEREEGEEEGESPTQMSLVTPPSTQKDKPKLSEEVPLDLWSSTPPASPSLPSLCLDPSFQLGGLSQPLDNTRGRVDHGQDGPPSSDDDEPLPSPATKRLRSKQALKGPFRKSGFQKRRG